MFSLNSRKAALLAIGIASLIPVSVLHLGYTGSDFEFHLQSWKEFLEVWRSGVLVPSWAPHANFNLGEPRFLFYPPLSFALGAILAAFLPFQVVPQAFICISLFLSGLAMRKLSREFLPPSESTWAALLYIANYYLLVDVLLRFAAAEVLAAAALPLVLLYFLRLASPGARQAKLLGLSLAAIWMTDIPFAIAVFYCLLAGSLGFLALGRRPVVLLTFLGAQSFALLLVAWYLVPAFVEKQQISSTVLVQLHGHRDFLFQPDATAWFQLRYPLWLWTVSCSGLALTAQILCKRNPNCRDHHVLFRALACAAAFVLVIQIPVSAPLWDHLPQLRFVQFPFRFDMFLGCVSPIILLAAFRSPLARSVIGLAWIAAAMLPIGTRIMQEQRHHPTVSAAEALANDDAGYPGISEYGPAGVDLQALDRLHPPQIVDDSGGVRCAATVERWSAQQRGFHTSSAQACLYQVGLMYYPDWHATVDGQPADIVRKGPQNLVLLGVPAGDHRVTLSFAPPRSATLAGGILTLFGVVWVGLALYRDRTGQPGVGESRLQPLIS